MSRTRCGMCVSECNSASPDFVLVLATNAVAQPVKLLFWCRAVVLALTQSSNFLANVGVAYVVDCIGINTLDSSEITMIDAKFCVN